MPTDQISTATSRLASSPKPRAHATGALRCRQKFLRVFPNGFYDGKYLDWERDYKWLAHRRWKSTLDKASFGSLIRRGRHAEIATIAVAIESRTNLLFSFEKMALRDAIREPGGARRFAEGLFEFLHGRGPEEARFMQWCDTLAGLPRKQTRVLNWPVATVFGFIAQPARHIYFKPRVTQIAAARYGFDLAYQSRPNWPTYERVRNFARQVRRDVADLRPRDMIDLQSFIWVQGSDEY